MAKKSQELDQETKNKLAQRMKEAEAEQAAARGEKKKKQVDWTSLPGSLAQSIQSGRGRGGDTSKEKRSKPTPKPEKKEVKKTESTDPLSESQRKRYTELKAKEKAGTISKLEAAVLSRLEAIIATSE